jgi:glutathione S-transferase
MAAVKLYGVPLSAPFRGVEILLKLLNVPFEVVPIDPSKGDQRKPEFLAINPLGQIPAIQEGDFTLGESNAILIYLQAAHSGTASFYPLDPKLRAKVDQFLHWHHAGTRKVSWLAFGIIFAPSFGIQLPPTFVQEQRDNATKALTTMERWLTAQPYLAGEEMTLADVAAFPEVDQGRLIDLDLSSYPHVQAWIARLQEVPAFQESTAGITAFKAVLEAKAKAAA